jgi:hypothetical protein
MISSTFAFAKGLTVICNEALNVDSSKVISLFTGETSSVGGVSVLVSDNKTLQVDFLSNVLKIEQTKYDTIWAKKSFREGLTKPAMKSSDIEVIDFVKSNKGGVGYVSKPGTGVKTLGSF